MNEKQMTAEEWLKDAEASLEHFSQYIRDVNDRLAFVEDSVDFIKEVQGAIANYRKLREQEPQQQCDAEIADPEKYTPWVKEAIELCESVCFGYVVTTKEMRVVTRPGITVMVLYKPDDLQRLRDLIIGYKLHSEG